MSLYKRVNETTHCETGFNKLYTETVIDMLNDAKESFPIKPRILKILVDRIERGDKIGELHVLDENQIVEWFIKNFVIDFISKQGEKTKC